MESSLEYIGRSKGHERVHEIGFEQVNHATTVSAVVRGWVCGSSAIPIDILSTFTATSTKSSDGKSYTRTGIIVETGIATETWRDEPAPTNTPTDSGPAYLDDEDTYDCHLEVEGEYYTEYDCYAEEYYGAEYVHIVLEEADSCAGECVKKIPRSTLPLNVRRHHAPSQPGDQEIMTIVRVTTTTARPVETTVPAAAPGLTITEAVLIASTKHTNQTSRPPLSEVTRTLDIVLPSETETGIVTSSTQPRTSGSPRLKSSRTEDGDASSSSKVVGAVVGSLLGAVSLIGGLWCYFYYRRKQRERRWRERRDSNPVSSRITANLWF